MVVNTVSNTRVSTEKLRLFFEKELFLPQLVVRNSIPSVQFKKIRRIIFFFIGVQRANLRIIDVLINIVLFILTISLFYLNQSTT